MKKFSDEQIIQLETLCDALGIDIDPSSFDLLAFIKDFNTKTEKAFTFIAEVDLAISKFIKSGIMKHSRLSAKLSIGDNLDLLMGSPTNGKKEKPEPIKEEAKKVEEKPKKVEVKEAKEDKKTETTKEVSTEKSLKELTIEDFDETNLPTEEWINFVRKASLEKVNQKYSLGLHLEDMKLKEARKAVLDALDTLKAASNGTIEEPKKVVDESKSETDDLYTESEDIDDDLDDIDDLNEALKEIEDEDDDLDDIDTDDDIKDKDTDFNIDSDDSANDDDDDDLDDLDLDLDDLDLDFDED